MVASRDTTSGFPLVYKEWTLERDGRQEHYVIQDLPPEDDELALREMIYNFVRDEPTCKSTNAIADKVAEREMGEYWKKKIAQRTALACYSVEEGKKTLVGLNVCYVSDKNIEEENVIPTLKSKSWKQIASTLSLMEELFNPHELLGVDRYLSAAGLFVTPALRGRGIAVELVKAREGLCKALGVPATATVFTATASQHVATKCGFRVLGELAYKDLVDRGLHFATIDSPVVKIMGRTYDI